ncbi:FAD:protein FMN transferase [hydrothermal vent metagenome]|uniref:FAD:protein FMN transferase n=1 Tax=hydrothermal vent metagenome TaxID=652676 RepID=A0A3B1D402_9ZZZZ
MVAVKYLLLILLFTTGCAQAPQQTNNKYHETRMLMGTIVNIDVCRNEHEQEDIQKSYQRVWERLEEISWRMNVFDEKSEVTQINNSNGNTVSIQEDTYYVLQRSMEFFKQTSGAFDITVWPLIKLWKQAAKNNRFPSQEELINVKKGIGLDKVELLEGNQVRLKNKETKVDLGGIAKGYAVDEAARIFREEGIDNFFIDAGGDIYVGGMNCRGQLWRIGVRDPRDKSKIFNVVEVSNAAVTTSGNYEQYYDIQGERFSHIIDPITGYPQKEVVSATVIAPDALNADSLSTALAVLGAMRGTKLINTFDYSHASIIMIKQDDGTIKNFKSNFYGNYQKNK